MVRFSRPRTTPSCPPIPSHPPLTTASPSLSPPHILYLPGADPEPLDDLIKDATEQCHRVSLEANVLLRTVQNLASSLSSIEDPLLDVSSPRRTVLAAAARDLRAALPDIDARLSKLEVDGAGALVRLKRLVHHPGYNGPPSPVLRDVQQTVRCVAIVRKVLTDGDGGLDPERNSPNRRFQESALNRETKAVLKSLQTLHDLSQSGVDPRPESLAELWLDTATRLLDKAGPGPAVGERLAPIDDPLLKQMIKLHADFRAVPGAGTLPSMNQKGRQVLTTMWARTVRGSLSGPWTGNRLLCRLYSLPLSSPYVDISIFHSLPLRVGCMSP